MRNYTIITLIALTLFTACSKTDNHDSKDNTTQSSTSSQSALEAPVVDAPTTTQNENVTVTVRTLPSCEVYLGNEHVATSDSEGIALVTLPLLQNQTNTFAFKIKSNGRFSESVTITIQRVTQGDSNSSQSSTASQGLHVSSSAMATSSEASSSVSSQNSSTLASSSSSASLATPAFKLLSPKSHVEYAYVTLEINATNTQALSAINTTLSGEQNRTLRINGVRNGGVYYLYNLPLLQGDNDINLSATNGTKTVSSTITLTSDANGSAPIALRAEEHEGIQSLSTPVQAATLLDASQYLFDTDGDGLIDTTKNDGNITVSLNKEGRYKPRVTIRTTDNVLYSSNDFALSLDVKADAAQKDPAGAQPVDEAKHYVQAIIDDDREAVERFLGHNERLIGYIYGDPRVRPFLAKAYQNITNWEQTYHDSGYASVKILFEAEDKTYGGGFEMVTINPQVSTGREWIVRFFY